MNNSLTENYKKILRKLTGLSLLKTHLESKGKKPL
jgi:hypothetical protein